MDTIHSTTNGPHSVLLSSPTPPQRESTNLEELCILSTLSMEDIRSYTTSSHNPEERVLAVRSAHNDLATPLHRLLPPEMLLEIFTWIFPTSMKDIRIAHVCRTWRRLLLVTPSFWAALLSVSSIGALRYDWHDQEHLRRRKERLQTLLVRSEPHTFSVRRPLEIDAMSIAYQILAPHLSRISSLKIHLSSSLILQHFCELLKSGMTSLEELFVSHDPHAFCTNLDANSQAVLRSMPSGGILPRLRTLHIPSFLMTMRTSISTLHTVQIAFCGCRACEEAQQLDVVLEYLHRHPNLVSFDYNPSFRSMSSPSFSSLCPSLPRLQKLSLGVQKASKISALLSRLTLPSEATIEVQVLPDLGSEIVPLAMQALPMMASLDKVSIVLYNYSFSEQASITGYHQGSVRLSLALRPHSTLSFNTLRGAVLTLFPPTMPAVESLSFKYVGDGDAFWEHSGTLLRVFPSTTHLQLTFSASSARSLLSGGPPSARTLEADMGSALPVPRLKSLTIRWTLTDDMSWTAFERDREFLVAWLAHRAERGARLEELTLSCSPLDGLTGPTPLTLTQPLDDWLVRCYAPFVDCARGRVCEEEIEKEEDD